MSATIVGMTLTDDLLALYRVDSQLRGLRTRVENAARTLKVRETKLADLCDKQAELVSNIRQLTATVENLDGESGDFLNRIEKLRVDLNAATTDKQYQAILTEMKVMKDQRDSVDDQSMGEMERLEGLKAKLEELEEKIVERTKVRDAAIVEHKERGREVAGRVEELERERAIAASAIPESSLAVFDRVADDNDGETLSPVNEINKRRHEYACGVCHVEIPYNLVVTLLSGGAQIQQCPQCMRILHLETANAAG